MKAYAWDSLWFGVSVVTGVLLTWRSILKRVFYRNCLIIISLYSSNPWSVKRMTWVLTFFIIVTLSFFLFSRIWVFPCAYVYHFFSSINSIFYQVFIAWPQFSSKYCASGLVNAYILFVLSYLVLECFVFLFRINLTDLDFWSVQDIQITTVPTYR